MLLEEVILRDTRANQPAANLVAEGSLYYVTDEQVTERSNGLIWEDYSDTGSGGGAITQLTGDITAGPGSGSQVATIGNASVSYAKIQDVSAADRLLGRGNGGGAGDIQEITLGTNLSMTGTTLNAAGGGGGSAFLLQCKPQDYEPTIADYATLDSRNAHPLLDFDDTVDEFAMWTLRLPEDYGGGGLTVSTFWAFTSAIAGTLGIEAAIEFIALSGLDIDADSFAAAQAATGVAPGTNGQVIQVDILFTDGGQMDSLTAGGLFRLRVNRDVSVDTVAGDAELMHVTVKET